MKRKSAPIAYCKLLNCSYFKMSYMSLNSIKDIIGEKGDFQRKSSVFRNTISKGGPFPPEADRYHLYISLACPWAHRTLIVRNLKGLDHAIGLSVVHYLMLENGWEFANSDVPGCIPDTVNSFKMVRELYFQSDANYAGRFTVPILYDKKTKCIVNNESSEIIRMFNSEFNEFAKNPELDMYPEALRSSIDEINARVYDGYNNGVYKAGFATSQQAYEENAKLVHDTMVWVNEILSDRKYLCGDALTEADIRLFTTVIRHDPVYLVHFKCNLVAVKDLQNLSRWVKLIYQNERVQETVNMEHIKKHYYMSHKHINPSAVCMLQRNPIDVTVLAMLINYLSTD
ncbi:Glutathionyl-hydroquinone reductase YqjG [Orchesella cincta]|uniref:Glutathionyl-hydroquinone reductase YqjG n=1 Tax=Orchesella cincta TaxID=48709 RepID=A0A1D2MT86_ORCCI|nr:Glutathionyl-hydroquinone reductase YqjG [Orchesella cincta]